MAKSGGRANKTVVLPNLIHPVPISLQVITRSATIYDEDMREPVQQSARGATVIVSGQVKWGLDQSFGSQRVGPAADSDGYVLFRLVDLAAATPPVTLQRDDRFIRLGTIDVDVYITGLRYEGHYPDQGGPSLVKAFFKDRLPARDTRGV